MRIEKANNLQELISIIIPAYNAEDQIRRSIVSAMQQSYVNLEIIIIDDGSKDNTGKIADLYASEDHRVRVFHVQNGGEAKSRNLGLMEARGSLIAFCDADDRMHPDMLEKLYNSLMENDADMAVCSWNYVDSSGNELNWRTPDLATCCLDSTTAQKYFLQSINFEGFAWNKLIKKDLYIKHSIRYDENRLSYCDILASFRLIQESGRICFVNEKLYDYYQVPDSCIHTPNLEKFYDYVEVMEQVKQAAVKTGLMEYGKKYQIYRLYKHMFWVYKERIQYKSDEMELYFKNIYEKYLDYSDLKKVKLALEYPDENPFKFFIKMLLVKKYYRKIKKIKEV